MTFQEFIDELDDSLLLLESGPNIYLRHYTTWDGLIGILSNKAIKGGHPYWSPTNKATISVFRSSNSISDIENIIASKNPCGYFYVEPHKARDIVKNLKLIHFNEIWDQYNKLVDDILRKYDLKKKDVWSDIDNWRGLIDTNDWKKVKEYIQKAEQSRTDKEFEDRIVTDELPLNTKFLKFIFIKSVVEDYIKTHSKKQTVVIDYIENKSELFERNKFFNELEKQNEM